MRKFLLVLFVLFTYALTFREKISPYLMQQIQSSPNKVDFIILMKEQVDLTKFNQKLSSQHEWDIQAKHIFEELQEIARRSQANVLKILKNYSTQSFWSTNCIAVFDGDLKIIEEIAKRDDVLKIEANPVIKADLAVKSVNVEFVPTYQIEPSIQWIKAPQVWEKGYKGQGIIVANADTGVQWDHESLIESYLGNKGDGKIDHNYAWYDALHKRIDKPPNVCGYNLTVPCDDYGHGTHVIGTIASKFPNRVFSVAPEAKWMACRNMDHGLGSSSTFLECMQFFLAPTDVYGKNPDVTKRPHVVTNSYGCSRTMCGDVFQQTVEALRKAGVAVIASAGNSGSCSSTNGAPAYLEATITVGALAKNSDSIARFSSKGPVTVDKSNRLKPNLVCPGTDIYSCTHRNLYSVKSGTSMACPHVAGSIALLWSAFPKLARDVDTTQKILEMTAKQQQSKDCKSTQPSPNNVYGYGTVDLLKAYEYAQNLTQ